VTTPFEGVPTIPVNIMNLQLKDKTALAKYYVSTAALPSSESAWIIYNEGSCLTPVAMSICGMKLELINELFKYVSKKLPNFYVAGWNWYFGRKRSRFRERCCFIGG